MPDVQWSFKGREFINCNCAYGCPCQFNAHPTHGHCEAVAAMHIDTGHYGKTRLDGLSFVLIARWPGAIHERRGEAVVVVDEQATPDQREALLRIISGQDTEPGATVFQVFSTTFEKVHDPIFAPIKFDVDVDARRAQIVVPGITEGRGEPIVNPVTGQEHRVRINIPNGFEYETSESGRGWSRATGGPVKMNLSDSYGQFAHLHLSQSGVVH
jgi:hypothetical protein